MAGFLKVTNSWILRRGAKIELDCPSSQCFGHSNQWRTENQWRSYLNGQSVCPSYIFLFPKVLEAATPLIRNANAH